MFTAVEEAIAGIARGEMVVVVDSADRAGEGGLVMAAEQVTPEAVNFMTKHGRGLICVPMLSDRLVELKIPPMATGNSDPYRTALHVGVDHSSTTTGMAASERAATTRALSCPGTQANDFLRPGHVFPLGYRPGGVLRRAGRTEASVDLVTLAGLNPAAVACEIIADDGEMACTPQLLAFARSHGISAVTISDLVAYRHGRESLVHRRSSARLPLDAGDFEIVSYFDYVEGHEHVALVLGDLAGDPPLIRMHSECLTGDAFRSRRCDCGRQLQRAVNTIAAEGRGAIVYLRGHETHGIGLVDKLRAYELQDQGVGTVEANVDLGRHHDRSEYWAGGHILRDLRVKRLRLLTSHPSERTGPQLVGLEVVERIPLLGGYATSIAEVSGSQANEAGSSS